MKSLFAIRVNVIINEMLIADGWKVGDYVALSRETSYGISFCRKPLRNATFYDTRKDAENEISVGAGSHIYGVKFDVVEFREVMNEKRDQIAGLDG